MLQSTQDQIDSFPTEVGAIYRVVNARFDFDEIILEKGRESLNDPKVPR